MSCSVLYGTGTVRNLHFAHLADEATHYKNAQLLSVELLSTPAHQILPQESDPDCDATVACTGG